MNIKPFTAIICALAFGTAMPAFAQEADKDRIDAAYKADRERCNGLSGNAKDICQAEVKGKQKIALADLEARSKNTVKARQDAILVRANVQYEIAKEKCDDLAGNKKDVCVQEAKAVQTKARAEAKADRQTSEARSDAAETKRGADYKVAMERGDSLSGDAKDACEKAAKTKYDK